jgi:hypothetical protein
MRLLCQFADCLTRAFLAFWHLWFCSHAELIRATSKECRGQKCLRCRKFFPFAHCARRIDRARQLYVKQAVEFATDLSRFDRGLRPLPSGLVAEIESIGKDGTNG